MIRKKFHSFRFLLFASAVLFFFVACTPDGVLSARKMRRVLTDMHVLEGVIGTKYPGIPEREQVYYYQSIFLKHGVTKAEFDSSLVYYTKNPKAFERIYTRVVEDVRELNEAVIAGKFHPLVPDSTLLRPVKYRIWKLADKYQFDKDSARTKLAFSIVDQALTTQDYYYLKFRLRIAPQDSSRNTYAALRIYYADGKVDTAIHKTRNDSILRRYRFKMRANRNFRIDSITGELLGSAAYKGIFRAYLDSVSLEREYIPAYQDSLKLHLDTVPVLKATQPAKRIKDSAGKIKVDIKRKSSGNKSLRKIDNKEITR